MGFFSENCKRCNKSILSRYSTNTTNAWMKDVVAITPNGSIIKGVYDGYGRVEDSDYDTADVIGSSRNSVWHRACWELDGLPTVFQGGSTWAEDQGYFFNDEDYDVPDPRTALGADLRKV